MKINLKQNSLTLKNMHDYEYIKYATFIRKNSRKKFKRCNNLMLLQKQSKFSIKPKSRHFQKPPKYYLLTQALLKKKCQRKHTT